jgi:tetratricopeptide (TPR) repeat protein
MLPLQLSSGDLVADRRASYAQMLFEAGDHLPAAELMREALALAPDWAAGWFRLGEMLAEAGELAAAADAWREASSRRASAAAAETTCPSPDRVPLDTSRSGHTH